MPEPRLKTAESPLDESRVSYPGWKIVLAGFFGVMVSIATIVPSTYGLFIKPLAASFGWQREATSAGFSIVALTLALATPGLGFLFDRYKPRSIILPCIVLFSAAYCSLALLTPHLLHFYFTFFLIGLVGNGTSYIGYARAISTWFNLRRGFALSIMLAGSSLGSLILPVITQAAISHLGWRAAYTMLGLLAFAVGFPFTAIFVRERSAAHQNHHAPSESGEPVATALATPTFWIIAAAVCLNGISFSGVLTHLSALLTDRGVSPAGASWSIAIFGATSLMGHLVAGAFLDHFFAPRVSQVMLLMTFLGIVLLSVANTLTVGLIAAGLIGFSLGGEGDVTPYLLSRYFGLKRFSTLYALTSTTFAVGAAAGPILVGRSFDSLASYRPVTIQLLALPVLISCLLMFGLPGYKVDRSEAKPIAALAESESPQLFES